MDNKNTKNVNPFHWQFIEKLLQASGLEAVPESMPNFGSWFGLQAGRMKRVWECGLQVGRLKQCGCVMDEVV
ncbi:MAG: hypothetical protein ACNA7V_07305 [Bacteroidales bacterium]